MRRCLGLASMAEGLTYPNPMVGAVVVCDGIIIGEGYHLKAGEPHAEVIAINAVRDKGMLKRSVLYVSLEPCSHFGMTPPCADLIISHSIPKVVIGTGDSNDKVSGRGISRLREAGCEVIVGVLKDECRRLNRRFFTFHEKKRPYITLKWAQSADGFIDILRSDNHTVQPTWITGKPERSLVHRWRTEEESILVGAGTVRADDPKLNVRDWTGRDPLRLILSSTGSLDKGSSVFKVNGKTILFTDDSNEKIPGVITIQLDNSMPACRQIAQYLFNSGIQSVLVEGGAVVLDHFISNGLWDEARVFSGAQYFKGGVPAPALRGNLFSETIFSNSNLKVYLNSAG
ncbi:MAG: bifunctional diaminohydroxyphosphoribosylaminopyrimidine deaminase/5-amino-6-(5-phosphoribosylamino)uracil reductase RibD [Bacteroidales bacterium]|nr:bifunctional diaminohydroxyphosphoribosylaminopyrimidine deaminase/5-amino-6-(5-phosphoribosylamino)uracil reductase RibD [Bacteroidales bacterium]